MKQSKMKLFFICVSAMTVGWIGIQSAGSEVCAADEPIFHVVREADGDLEQLEAIEISDEMADEWSIAESYQDTSNETSTDVNQFLSYGSDYGYQDMTKRSNSVGRQYAYQQLAQISKEFSTSGQDAEEIDLWDTTYFVAGEADLSDYALSGDEMIETYFTFRNDNPQYFWLSNEVIYSESSIVVLSYNEYGNGTARLSALEEIIDTSRQVYQTKISAEDSRYQKVLKIHDALIEDIEYSFDTEIPTAHSIAGAMTSDKSAVCEGYAKVMQVMLNQYGIKNIYVTGDAGGGHAWNMVRMDDGKYYWLDATWDDQEDEIFQHEYFLVGNLNFADHQADKPSGTSTDFLYELPEASDEDYVDDPTIVVIVKGDVNEDGQINLQDLMLCLNYVSKKGTLEGNALLAADIDENGQVNLQDLMKLLNYVSKKTSSL